MEEVNLNQDLKEHFELVKQCTLELVKEEPAKSAEQLLSEIEFVKNLLEETKHYIKG